MRRAVSVVVEPLRADVAAWAIRRRKTEQIADRAQRARMGQVEDAGLTAELRDVLQQEADLAAGHGLCRYAGLVAVSAASSEELDAACASVEQATIQAGCELRWLVMQQGQAFVAAALPLGRGI